MEFIVIFWRSRPVTPRPDETEFINYIHRCIGVFNSEVAAHDYVNAHFDPMVDVTYQIDKLERVS